MKYTSLLLVGIAFVLGIGIYVLDKKYEGVSLGSRFDSVRISSNCTSTTFIIGATSTVVSGAFTRNYTDIALTTATNTIFYKLGLLAASNSGIPLYPGDPSLRSTSSANDRIRIWGEEWSATISMYALSTNSQVSVTNCR